jgi:hypothetical protein
MWRKTTFIVPALAALLMLAGNAHGQFESGNWALTLSGSGANDQDFDGGTLGLNGSVGYFLSKEFELGLRQGVTWSDSADGADGSVWAADTRLFADYYFDMDRWQPYVGAFAGYSYGDVDEDSWIGGPEVGAKYFVNSSTFIDVNVAYAFNLEEGLDGGGFFYGLGIGFRF